jgi:hypothetical protein
MFGENSKVAHGSIAVLAFALAAGAAHAAPQLCHYVPTLNSSLTPVEVNDQALEAAVGFYQVGEHNLLVLTREGARLAARSAGQAPARLYPAANNRFFYEGGQGGISLVFNASGRVTSLVLHQDHALDTPAPRITEAAARKLEARLADRLDADTGRPKTEPALRHLLDSVLSGKPDYNRMDVFLEIATHRRIGDIRNFVDTLGPVQQIEYLGVRDTGFEGVDADTYTVWQKNGVSHWAIALDKNGKVVGTTYSCGP